MSKVKAFDTLWFNGKFDDDTNIHQIYMAPVDLVDEDSLNQLDSQLFIYKTKFNTNSQLDKDQIMMGLVSTDWYVVSWRRLSLGIEIPFENIHLKSTYCRPGFNMYSDKFTPMGCFYFAKFFNKPCIMFRADREYNEDNSDYISNFLGYITRNEKLNVYKVIGHIYVIGNFSLKEMEDYCQNTFCDIDEITTDISDDKNFWSEIVPLIIQ